MDEHIKVQNEGSLVLLTPISDEAVAWFDEHLPKDALTWGNATVVEPRYVEDILKGFAADLGGDE